jgi:hypothetical protein
MHQQTLSCINTQSQHASSCVDLHVFDRHRDPVGSAGGNTYTLADTEHLVIQSVSAQGKLDAERVMILNHKEAIRYLVQNVRSLTPTEETIRTVHYLLSDSLVPPGMAGQIQIQPLICNGK